MGLRGGRAVLARPPHCRAVRRLRGAAHWSPGGPPGANLARGIPPAGVKVPPKHLRSSKSARRRALEDAQKKGDDLRGAVTATSDFSTRTRLFCANPGSFKTNLHTAVPVVRSPTPVEHSEKATRRNVLLLGVLRYYSALKGYPWHHPRAR